jgi:xanthine dehydrogenase accessory factor
MTALWIAELLRLLEAGEPAVLVGVAAVEGSAPREAGAKMIVTRDRLHGTIGGGQLEYGATEDARELLRSGEGGARLIDVALGPQLGQCCGGRARLLFEPIGPTSSGWLHELDETQAAGGRALLVTRLGPEPGKWLVRPASREPSDLPNEILHRLAAGDAADIAVHVEEPEDGVVLVFEGIEDRRQSLYLFGAGHVGQALARALAPLAFRVTWVDSRADAFPPDLPAGVAAEQVDPPRFAVERAPAGAYYLVMTHSHPLDQEVCEAVLRRGDAGYLGLIGSATKRARFVKRLAAKGLDGEVLARLHCPIGLAGIAGKDPAIIAASVAADLLVRVSAGLADAKQETGGANG